MDIKCIGCGANIQCDDEKKIGYLPFDVLNARKVSDILCQRCFRLRNYKDVMSIEVSEDDFLKVINKIEPNSLILMVVDIFDFNGSFINGISRHTSSDDIIVVGNKLDLLPKSVKPNKIINWMRRMCKEEGLKPLDATLISAKKGYNLDNLMDIIDKYRKNRNVYVVGCSNVGKSTLINSIIKRYTDQTKDVITASKLPGTTLDLVEIALTENYKIVDTPGIFNKHQICHSLSMASYEKVMPTNEIKPTVFQLEEKQCLFISGLGIITFKKSLVPLIKVTFACYFSNELRIHRTKLEKKESIKNQIGELLVPPTEQELKSIKYKKSNFVVPNDGKKYDIVISGLGFVSISSYAEIEVETLENVGVYLREAII